MTGSDTVPGVVPGVVPDLVLDPPEIAAPFVIVSEGQWPQVPADWPWHHHDVHELVWVRDGTMTTRVRTGRGGPQRTGRGTGRTEDQFTVPAGRGMWLPAGVPHAGRLTAGAVLCDAFFSPERTPVAFAGPTVVTMTPVLESLLTHLARTDLTDDARARAEAVVFDVLEPAEGTLSLPVPDDPRIAPLVETLLADPGHLRSLDGWARELGLSERTVTRAFRAGTGMAFGRWRQILRIQRAVTLLSEGAAVHEVSAALGYAQPSTFIAAFRRVTGRTPGTLR